MHKPLDSMNSNVLLARVSLRYNLLCVCDLKGVIVFASDDLLWALGLQGPTTRHIGASLFDLLADEDVEEYKVGYGGFLVEKSHRKATVSASNASTPVGSPKKRFFVHLKMILPHV